MKITPIIFVRLSMELVICEMFMCFSTKQDIKPMDTNIFIDDTEIEQVDSKTVHGLKMNKFMS